MNALSLHHARPLAAVFFVIALLLSACGGDGSPTGPGVDEVPGGSQDLSGRDDDKSAAPDGGADAPSTIAPGEYHPEAPLATVQDLIEHLRAQGGEVIDAGPSSETSLFLPAPHLLTVDGQDVRAFGYDSVEALKADATKISPDGGTLNGTPVRWMAAPHFYARGTVIVLYVGVDEGVVHIIESVMGTPFAGQGALAPEVVDPIEPGAYEMRKPALVVAGTDEELARLRPFLTADAASRLDGVDLSANYVVAVFRGAMPTAGYAIAIDAIDVDAAGQTVVSIRLADPEIDALVAQVITYPVAVQVVSRSQAADPATATWVARTTDGKVLARLGDSTATGGIVPTPGDAVDGTDATVTDPLPRDTGPLPVDSGDPGDPSVRFHIAGTITESELSEAPEETTVLARFLVRGDGSTGYDVAWVEVLKDTAISFDGETFAPPTLADLAPGRQVQVVFAGPVRESYPVQAVAGHILILR